MSQFEDYIYQPEAVERNMPELQAWHLEPIRRIDDAGWLDLAVGVEQESLAQHQPRLNVLAECLAAHYRIKHNGRPAMFDHIRYGFAIGALAAAKVYTYKNDPVKGPNASGQEDARFKVYYRDVSEDTLEAFETSEALPLDMMLDALQVNTKEKTARLRELIDHYLVLERPSPDLEEATKIGALVCYSIMTFERKRALDARVKADWDRYDDEQEPVVALSPAEWTAQTPYKARQEIEELEAIRASRLSLLKKRLSRSRTA